MAVVPMRTEHYPSLVQLWSSFSGNTMTGADSSDGFNAFLAVNGDYCFASVHDGRVTGSVMAGEDSRRGYIYHLAVESSRQNTGLGRELMTRCEKALHNAGIEKIHLFIYTDNPAVEFYRKMGWHVRDDILVMSKVLHGERYLGTRTEQG